MTETLPPADAPITLHGRFTSGNAYKAALLLELAGREWTFKFVARDDHTAPEFRTLGKFGQVPILEHGDFVLTQSNLIVHYLSNRLGKFGPEGPVEDLRIAEWLYWEQDLMLEGVARTRAIRMFLGGDPTVIAFHKGIGERALKDLERALEKADWLVGGRITIADLCAYGYAHFIEEAEFDIADWPAIEAWRARIRALPGWADANTLMPAPAT